MSDLFKVHILNEEGIQKAKDMQEMFTEFERQLSVVCSIPETGNTREYSIVRTKLEEACFFAKKAMAMDVRNQK